jgi:hypothetical protein
LVPENWYFHPRKKVKDLKVNFSERRDRKGKETEIRM